MSLRNVVHLVVAAIIASSVRCTTSATDASGPDTGRGLSTASEGSAPPPASPLPAVNGSDAVADDASPGRGPPQPAQSPPPPFFQCDPGPCTTPEQRRREREWREWNEKQRAR
jgi:hypothetical protein